MKKQAVILAGGKGTRLLEVTGDKVPKPLIEILPGLTMLDYAINGLLKVGVTKIYITTYHLSKQIQEYLDRHYKDRSDLELKVVEEDKELGTGGSVLSLIKSGVSDPLLVLSSDTFFVWSEMKDFIDNAFKNIKGARAIFGITNDVIHSQAPFNIWFNKKDKLMVSYQNRINSETPIINEKFIDKTDLYSNITGAGIVVLNSKMIGSEMELRNVQFPVCLYNDWLPVWAERNYGIYVEFLQSMVLDMGTPDRLALAKKLVKKKLDKGSINA